MPRVTLPLVDLTARSFLGLTHACALWPRTDACWHTLTSYWHTPVSSSCTRVILWLVKNTATSEPRTDNLVPAMSDLPPVPATITSYKSLAFNEPPRGRLWLVHVTATSAGGAHWSTLVNAGQSLTSQRSTKVKVWPVNGQRKSTLTVNGQRGQRSMVNVD